MLRIVVVVVKKRMRNPLRSKQNTPCSPELDQKSFVNQGNLVCFALKYDLFCPVNDKGFKRQPALQFSPITFEKERFLSIPLYGHLFRQQVLRNDFLIFREVLAGGPPTPLLAQGSSIKQI